MKKIILISLFSIFTLSLFGSEPTNKEIKEQLDRIELKIDKLNKDIVKEDEKIKGSIKYKDINDKIDEMFIHLNNDLKEKIKILKSETVQGLEWLKEKIEKDKEEK